MVQGTVSGTNVWRRRSRKMTVTVQTLPDVSLDSPAARLALLGGRLEGRAVNSIAGYLLAIVPSDHLTNLAALDGVIWVERYMPPRLLNDVAGGTILRANEVRQSLALYGSGQGAAAGRVAL